jgi:hypothetical protein
MAPLGFLKPQRGQTSKNLLLVERGRNHLALSLCTLKCGQVVAVAVVAGVALALQALMVAVKAAEEGVTLANTLWPPNLDQLKL